ncbi:23S rRNA (guanosine(2251)-2'-O)-methyltransferase RlmB [Bailinhaonella thermotolerans]|uniref:23S rRNA (Guanosine(2251)-2'-O)-methyltransferase RlmB n=1 Tax=Bailinhaonella thermotolerans TaxID=1070861 RepID=A0A3A4AU24_9ACTN|nr:23S rRNA (guanosine(2251)-2'-O)-methyltransferase RlmB [Bailinhaonella thermotolerans]RJL30814.1 23S rRNA (guanosine(2251)-2'-O)-methyltransferase RlmB [Bailinhaonella thermotolerans]
MAGGKSGGSRKKGPSKGTGGHVRRALEGKGPTPPASMRPWFSDKKRREARATGKAAPAPAARGGGRTPSRTRSADAPEVVSGRNPVVEALRARVPATALYVAQRIDNDDRVRESIKLAADRGIALMEAARSELDRLTDGASHQGLVLKVPAYSYAHPDDLLDRAREAAETPLIVALDGVTDPRNLGAIVRSAAAFGAHGLLVPSRRSAGVTASAWKTSAGTLASTPVARAVNLTRALEEYRERGLFVIGLDGEGDVDIDAVDLAADPLVIVVGSEGKGLSRLVRESCDQVVRIPMGAAAESLNAGVAAGIALYEVARKRRGGH